MRTFPRGDGTLRMGLIRRKAHPLLHTNIASVSISVGFVRREATGYNLCGREEKEKSSLSKSLSQITISLSLPSARVTRPESSLCHSVALLVSRTAGLRHARARARRLERRLEV